jgi:Na+/proline symporter
MMPVLIKVESLKITQRHDISSLLLTIRRTRIILLLLLVYLYFHFVVKRFTFIFIGMYSFSAVAQFSPAIIGGIFWKDATKLSAFCGLLTGFLIWGYTLVLPSLVQENFIPRLF